MAFIETQFPSDISYGAQGGAKYSTDVVETFSGWEQRNINWSESRGEWNVSHGVKTSSQLATLIAFFRACRGKAVGFRFKDWSDYSAANQIIGTGNGVKTAFQLVKSYTAGSITVDRTITKPVNGTVQVYKNGVLQGSGYTVDYTTGIVTFTAAVANAVVVTANFEFDVPARFDTDKLDITLDTFNFGSWGSIPIVEIRL
jgi:uncharacterized protein (TIGR02217 family)